MRKVVLIIEDDASQLEMLRRLVLKTSKDVEVLTANNSMVAYQALMERTIDVFLVDIVLDTENRGDTSGIRLVERFRKIPKYMFTPVIFVTSLEDSTMYAYKELNCIGYIEKPFEPAQVMCLVEKALNFTTARDTDVRLSFRKDGIWYPVKIKDVVYMESLKHVMNIHFAKNSVLEIPYVTCKQILKDADCDCLVQCSRSTIVNRDYVHSVDPQNQYIVFKEKLGRVNIGVTYKKKMIAEFGNDS
ncbi:MAG: response regulator transcription factor [Lachnospiraceae bacterium]|nr:response regulator transcription factor [Lachnospiraceae bacterium]